jgi:hypothetical protein
MAESKVLMIQVSYHHEIRVGIVEWLRFCSPSHPEVLPLLFDAANSCLAFYHVEQHGSVIEAILHDHASRDGEVYNHNHRQCDTLTHEVISYLRQKLPGYCIELEWIDRASEDVGSFTQYFSSNPAL